MDYNQPYGGGAGAAYVNGNPASGVQGSIIPAAAAEYPQREIVALITKAGLTPSNSDLTQLAQAVQVGAVIAATDTGTANGVVITLSPAPTVYPHMLLIKKSAAGNTGAVTVAINTLTAVAVKTPALGALANAQWPANAVGLLLWDGTQYQLSNVISVSGSGGAGGSTVRNITVGSYDSASGVSGPTPFGEGIVAGTGAEASIVAITGIATGTGFKRRISWEVSGKTLAGAVLGETAEWKIERSTDGGTTWSVMVACWCGLTNNSGVSTDATFQSDGGTIYDLLDTANAYRIAAQSYGDSTIMSNHARLTIEEIG